jgi:hypothetical protein
LFLCLISRPLRYETIPRTDQNCDHGTSFRQQLMLHLFNLTEFAEAPAGPWEPF